MTETLSDIYIDESSQTRLRYLVIGGIIIPTDRVNLFNTQLQKSRLPELPNGEAKWQKVSRAKLPAYKRMVDFFFDNQIAKGCDFHSVVVDSHKVDHRRFSEGDREIGFNKEVFQLGMKFGRLYPGLFHVYPDHRETNQGPEELRLILNRSRAKKGDKRDWPYRRCQFRHSHKCLPIQMVDIFIGGIAYRLNKHHMAPNASPAKTELSEYILSRANIADPTKDTAMSGAFTVWHRQLRK